VVKLHVAGTADAVYRALEEGAKEGPRAHLGASVIGGPCDRQLWLSFRWARQERHSGRVLRLFRRGQNEEAELTKDLRAAGYEVMDLDPGTGEQFRFEALGGHFGGSMDGIIRGIPEASGSDKWHVLEYKTHSVKSFADLKKNGVEKSKPQHYAQVIVYMHLSGDTNESRMTRALYIAVCKDNDELYVERIKYVNATAKKLMARAERIVYSDDPLERVSADPSWYRCKWCHFSEHCHGSALPAVSCRTCVHVTATEGGWQCERDTKSLDYDAQRAACVRHLFAPHLVPYLRINTSSEEGWVEYEMDDGRKFRNGLPPGDGCYTSLELTGLDPKLIGDKGMDEIRAEFDAHVVPSEFADLEEIP